MQHLKGGAEAEAEKWMTAAAIVAQNALCLRSHCGSVVVKDGEIIGKGYNAPPLDDIKLRTCLHSYDASKKPKYDLTCCMHAEWRAIMDALRHNPDKIRGAKLYFCRIDENNKIKRSGEPYCTHCSRMAFDAGLSHFLLWQEQGIAEYPAVEYNELSYQYFARNNV